MALKFVITRQSSDSTTPLPLYEANYTGSIFTIGSNPSADLHIEGIASEQIVVLDENNQTVLVNKAEGTLINNKQLEVEAKHELSEGDRVQIKDFILSIVDSDEISKEYKKPTYQNGNLSKPHTNFSEVLNSLRTQEDRFYILIEGGSQSGTCIPLDGVHKEIQFRWDTVTQTINFDVTTSPYGVIRKDWGGISLQPVEPNKLCLNGNSLNSLTSQQLKNGDRVTLQELNIKSPTLVFHSPVSLQMLDSLFPNKIPQPLLPTDTKEEADPPIQKIEPITKPQLTTENKSVSLNPFYVFSLLELVLMIIGTCILAGIIFLALSLM